MRSDALQGYNVLSSARPTPPWAGELYRLSPENGKERKECDPGQIKLASQGANALGVPNLSKCSWEV